MSRRCKQFAAGLFFVLLSISDPALAQNAAAGVDPGVLARANAGDAASQFMVGMEYQRLQQWRPVHSGQP